MYSTNIGSMTRRHFAFPSLDQAEHRAYSIRLYILYNQTHETRHGHGSDRVFLIRSGRQNMHQQGVRKETVRLNM